MNWLYFSQDSEVQGYIHVEEMFSIAKCEDELSRDSKYRFCFEVNTQGRGYLFSAETEEDMEEWVSAFEKIISRDAADNLVRETRRAVKFYIV